MPLDQAALFGCAVLTGVGAVVNTAHVTAGSTVAVVGLGGVGLGALLARASPARERDALAVDLAPDKLRAAPRLGATDTVKAGDADAVEQVREANTNGGVEIRLRDGRVGQGAGACLSQRRVAAAPPSPPCPASPAAHAIAVTAGQPGRRGAHAQGLLHRHVRARSRDLPALSRAVSPGRLPVNRLLSGTPAARRH